VRFLQQATFGANIADVVALKQMSSYEAWIDDQFTKPVKRPTSGSARKGALGRQWRRPI
jgi:hypothetical protein